VSGNDKVDETALEERLRCAVASVTGFDLRRQHGGTYQIVWMSELTGAALPFEDGLTIDDVERWVDENVVKDEQ
jgi:hypothetical protein